MKIARIAAPDLAPGWALIDEAAATARRLDGAFYQPVLIGTKAT